MRTAFGRLVLDTDTRQLLEGATPVPLSPKAFDLLALRIDNRPRALSKDELHEQLWRGTHVADANLAGLVAEIRRAVGDDARSARFVRTVQRFGYALSGAANAYDRAMDRAGPAQWSFWLVDGKRQIPLAEGENVLGRDPSQAPSRRRASHGGMCASRSASPRISRRAQQQERHLPAWPTHRVGTTRR
jgi:DNA-binding winged helix-turn-helix (wHTH) protein